MVEPTTTVHKHKRSHPINPYKEVRVREHSRKLQHTLARIKALQADPVRARATVSGRDGFDPDFATGYSRPGDQALGPWKEFREEMDKIIDSYEKGGAPPIVEKLDATHYFLRGVNKTGQDRVVWQAKGQAKFMDLKTDKKGRITVNLAAERLMDLVDGSRDGTHRNHQVDLAATAKIQVSGMSTKPKDRIQLYKWWRHPNESDIKGLDSANSDIQEILPKGKGKRKRHIILTGGTEIERGNVVEAVNNAFTVKEKKVLAGTVIHIGPTPSGVAGYYSQPTKGGVPWGAPRIVINNRYANKDDLVVVHECIHNLREHDTARKGALKATKTYRGRDKDLEEAMTEAETRSRQKPFTPGKGAGYYKYVRGRGNKSDADLETEDRITINNIDLKKHKLKNRNKRGKRAVNAVRKKYPETNLARIKMKGSSEAIDSFYQYEDEAGVKTNIHTRQPKGSKASDLAEQKVLKRGAKKVHEYRDGKKVRIK